MKGTIHGGRNVQTAQSSTSWVGDVLRNFITCNVISQSALYLNIRGANYSSQLYLMTFVAEHVICSR